MAKGKIAEERLCLFTSVDYTLIDTKDGVSFEGKIEPHKANIFTRQEAIEKMANALSLVQAKTFVDEIQWERVMNGCRYEAAAALNALLGVEK